MQKIQQSSEYFLAFRSKIKEAMQNQEFELQSAEIQKEILKEQLEIAE